MTRDKLFWLVILLICIGPIILEFGMAYKYDNTSITNSEYDDILKLIEGTEKCKDKFFELYKDSKITYPEKIEIERLCTKEKLDNYVNNNFPMKDPARR